MALVLVVDDDHSIVNTLELTLERMGHGVLACMDGLDAIALLQARRPRAVIADWQLGAISGIEVLSAAEQSVPEARRVLITASPGEPEVQEALRDGIVQVLVEKPWRLADLRAALRGL